MVDSAGTSHTPVLQRLLAAVNSHDLDAMVACFSADYVNETPAHPQRSFSGQRQVRRNWSQIFAGVPDIQARVLQQTAANERLWTEWEMRGRRTDGVPFLMRGVVIFTIEGETIASARFYLEPVEESTGDADAHARRVAGAPAKEPS